MHWYYATDGEQRGPFNDADFIQLVKDGTVGGATPVWNETMTDWLPYRDVKGEVARITRDLKEGDLAAAPEQVTCVECRGRFARDKVVGYRGSFVCGNCKQAFFQRIEEGGGILRGAGGVGATANEDLTAQAREALNGNWGVAVAFTLLFTIIMQSFQALNQFSSFFPRFLGKEAAAVAIVIAMSVSIIGSYILAGVFQLGLSRFYLDIIRGDVQGLIRLFYGFKFFWKAAGTYLLMMLYIMLWSLLLIIPGIIAGFSYAMTFFILADNPDIGAGEALERSKRVMKGNRWKLFSLYCRFIGWFLLAILTCGIGLLWVQPYMFTSMAAFYEDVRGLD